MNNLPPGVTGNEDVFGPKSETDVQTTITCPECGFSGEVTATREVYNSGAVDYWECPECATEDHTDVEEESTFDDPDIDWST